MNRVMAPTQPLIGPPDSKTEQSEDQPITGEWFACDRPEQPPEANVTAFHDCCTACLIAAEVAERNGVTHVTDDGSMVDLMRQRLLEWGEARR